MKNLLIFIGGASVGSFVTWRIIDKYYQNLADEEIKSVIETFKNRTNKEEKNKNINDSTDVEIKDKEVIKLHYDNTIDAMRYAPENIKNIEEDLINPKENKSSNLVKHINVISPEEFGEEDGYDTKSYTLWNDNILTDEFDSVIDDPTKNIGDALKHFGEYEDDAVYVRNTSQKCDYEILKSEKDFNS